MHVAVTHMNLQKPEPEAIFSDFRIVLLTASRLLVIKRASKH